MGGVDWPVLSKSRGGHKHRIERRDKRGNRGRSLRTQRSTRLEPQHCLGCLVPIVFRKFPQ